MEIKFCGAAREVTGSSHLLTLDNGLNILLDCGLYQGRTKDMDNYNQHWAHFKPADIDILILSHAHIDHIGRVPQLVKNGFTGEIFCTHATRSLASIMLADSARIQIADAKHEQRKALYDERDVQTCMTHFVGLSYNRWHQLDVGLKLQFRDAGHILGSASVTLNIERRDGRQTLFGFTGDIGRPDRPILNDPTPMPEVDYLICESTYGDKQHEDNYTQKEELLYIVKETCLLNEGQLVIPAFSLGRTQELVYMLDQLETEGRLPEIPVYVDSPLAVNATEIFRLHPECYDEQLFEYMQEDPNPFGFSRLHLTRSRGLADKLKHNRMPCIVISSSGMMTAGRVRRHLFNILGDQRNTLLIVGYAPPHTLGGRLRRQAREVRLFGKNIAVNATIRTMTSFSAHADQKEIADFLANQKRVKKLFLTHGEYDTQHTFRQYLRGSGFEQVEIPALGESYELE